VVVDEGGSGGGRAMLTSCCRCRTGGPQSRSPRRPPTMHRSARKVRCCYLLVGQTQALLSARDPGAGRGALGASPTWRDAKGRVDKQTRGWRRRLRARHRPRAAPEEPQVFCRDGEV
jgi:hypothetical protein